MVNLTMTANVRRRGCRRMLHSVALRLGNENLAATAPTNPRQQPPASTAPPREASVTKECMHALHA